MKFLGTGSETDSRTAHERRWAALWLLASTQFIVILDMTIIAIALPSIGQALHFSAASLSWVVNAYALTFGGFLLLGGRAADLLGRRRMFTVGLTLFALASLAGGLAANEWQLIAARAVQGLGAAILSPAALSMLATTFSDDAERAKAMGIWAAVAGSGGGVGVLLGGLLTDGPGWQWVFWVNVPIALGGALLASVLLPETRQAAATARFDVAGAVSVTGGLTLLVYGLVQAESSGWGSSRTALVLLASVVLLAAFVVIELRSEAPLVSFKVVRIRNVSVAITTMLLFAAGVYALMFFLSLYLQRVLGYDALHAGLSYIPLATGVLFAPIGSRLAIRIGIRSTLLTGLVLATIGIAWFSQISAGGSFVGDVLWPSFFIAAGGQFTVVGLTLSAMNGIPAEETGMVSGLFSTAQQIGAALGVGILATLAAAHTRAIATTNPPDAVALDSGYQRGLLGGLVFLVAAVLITMTLMPRLRPAAPPADLAAESAGGPTGVAGPVPVDAEAEAY
jgi:EmrB/QacA subfamily drug resistance transporter